MPPAALPASGESERLAALRSYDIIDTACEQAFDRVVDLAASLTGSPIALVSFVDAERQWFKARHGLAETETHRDLAFCAHAILEPGRPLVVQDATRDARFADNALVTGPPDIRAYLGVPLVSPEGHALGTLCVIDRVPRDMGERDVEVVSVLARAVVAALELRRLARRAELQALTDPLTGLPNRRAALAALSRVMENGRPVAAIAIDLDHFKEANDAEGHEAGDALLRAAGERLRAAVRDGDVVGRLGGDEFAVFLPGILEEAAAMEVAQRIASVLHRSVEYRGKALRLGATLGVALATRNARDPDALLRAADEAMLRAKRESRGSVGRAEPHDAERRLRAAAIARAFDEAAAISATSIVGLSVALHPIVSLRSDRLDGVAPMAVEALVRWHHPDLGDVSAGELLAAVGPARTARLGRAVRADAMATVAALRASGVAPNLRVAVNLAASEVVRPDVALLIEEQAAEAGLPLSAVEVEITEEVLLDRVSDRALAQLAGLRSRGARLALDDFGTGNSGLLQLLRLPLDVVKLDQRFVQRIGEDPRAEEIVRATVSLAHGLGLEVVAEGVETAAQALAVRMLGCDAAQGFLYARPMPSMDLAAWLLAREGIGVVNDWGHALA